MTIDEILDECVISMAEECALCAAGYEKAWDTNDKIFMHEHPGSGYIDPCSAPEQLQHQLMLLLAQAVFDAEAD